MQLSRLAVAAQLLAATAGAAQEPADPAQADIPDADRYGGEILAGTSLSEGTMLWVQGDYGRRRRAPLCRRARMPSGEAPAPGSLATCR
jgi:hypothetical protein